MSRLGSFFAAALGATAGAIGGVAIGNVVRGHGLRVDRTCGEDEVIGAIAGGALAAALAAEPAAAPQPLPPPRFP